MRLQSTLSLASVLAIANAHTIFLQLVDEGTTYGIGYGIPVPSYDGPILDVTTEYIACNGGPNPTTPSGNTITVKAGDTVQAVWRHTLTSTEENDSIYVVDPSHLGPTLAYMKLASNGSTDGPGGGWFKIQEQGLDVATQTWSTTELIANGGLHSITIPTCIEDGLYLLRAELIALHAAASVEGAQFYMECAQIQVTGGTGSATPSTVAFPGAYTDTDPGILIDIYTTLTTYEIPGPTPFVCGQSQGASSSTPTTLATSTKAASTSTKVSTSSTSTTSAASTGATQVVYGQCGGTGWTGPTVCAAGSTCTYSSAYYSQCLP